jgi:polyphosphate kinase
MIDREIKNAKVGKKAEIILKLNSMSDATLITKLYDAAIAGVEIKMVVRGIFCALTENKKFKKPFTAISIVDEYLEHARVMIFHNGGAEKVYISSADWMVRNLDHRIEAAVLITSKEIISELKDIINIQLRDNVTARWLDNELSNTYVSSVGKKKIRSQIETFNYLSQKVKEENNTNEKTLSHSRTAESETRV